jgi:hypothetical protein
MLTVGLPAIFWLHMNQGQYFKNWKKICLTIINVGILAIACAIVSLLDDFYNLTLRFRTNICLVWIGSLGIRCRDSRRLRHCQLVLRQHYLIVEKPAQKEIFNPQ